MLYNTCAERALSLGGCSHSNNPLVNAVIDRQSLANEYLRFSFRNVKIIKIETHFRQMNSNGTIINIAKHSCVSNLGSLYALNKNQFNDMVVIRSSQEYSQRSQITLRCYTHFNDNIFRFLKEIRLPSFGVRGFWSGAMFQNCTDSF